MEMDIKGEIINELWAVLGGPVIVINICFCFTEYAKAFDCVDHNKLWKILQEMGIPDHLTCIQLELDMEQQTGSNQERLYIVTLLI